MRKHLKFSSTRPWQVKISFNNQISPTAHFPCIWSTRLSVGSWWRARGRLNTEPSVFSSVLPSEFQDSTFRHTTVLSQFTVHDCTIFSSTTACKHQPIYKPSIYWTARIIMANAYVVQYVTEVTTERARWRRRRRKQLLQNLNEDIRYWNLQEKTLSHTGCKSRFGEKERKKAWMNK
jgi:hypothetical protein